MIVNFPFLAGDVPRTTSYGASLDLFALLGCLVILADFNARNRSLTAKLLQHGYRYHILRKAFSNFIVDTLNWFLNIIPD